ncbi:hypothetical protein G7054_g13087 [Neopestalotiopsis clavispora]|nr:hypothetical protein G7054_g13087 [Neopestalotiopsis clavispora]
MDDSQAGSDNESACGQPPYDGADIDLSNLWLDQTDPGDSRFFDSFQFDGGEPASDDQHTHNDGSFDPNIAAQDGISLGSPTNSSWQALRPDLALNSVPIDPDLYDQVDYTITAPPFSIPQVLYNNHHVAPMEVDSFVPLNYQRQPEYQNYLHPSASSGPSVQSAPSEVLSALSLPFSSPLARTNNSTTPTSYFDIGIPRQPGPLTDRSSGSYTERPFDCDRCTRRFRTRKDLDRHKHTHDPRWPEGQRVEGLFHCRCDPGGHDDDDSDSSSGSSSHINRCCRRARTQQQDYTLDLPYTAYRGAFLGGHYQLHQLRLQTEFLDIFSVVCLCGRVFEAQAFSLSLGADTLERPKQLMDSRRRRMKRIYRSDNFVDVFEDSGRRFLVSKVDRTEKEWRDVCDQIICRDVDYATELPARLIGGRRLQQKRGGRHHGGGNGGVGGACCNFDRRLESAATGTMVDRKNYAHILKTRKDFRQVFRMILFAIKVEMLLDLAFCSTVKFNTSARQQETELIN